MDDLKGLGAEIDDDIIVKAIDDTLDEEYELSIEELRALAEQGGAVCCMHILWRLPYGFDDNG